MCLRVVLQGHYITSRFAALARSRPRGPRQGGAEGGGPRKVSERKGLHRAAKRGAHPPWVPPAMCNVDFDLTSLPLLGDGSPRLGWVRAGQPTTCIGSLVHGTELGAAPGHFLPRTARFMSLPVRIHGSSNRVLVTTGRGHQTCIKKLPDVSWT